MTENATPNPIDVPLSLIAPVKLGSKATKATCGLFFPYRTNLPVGLVVDWEGDAHLIHLDGPHVFKEGKFGIGTQIQGAIINEIEYRVDVTSRYNAAQDFDPAGALVLKNGDLYLTCHKLGREYREDPYEVPLASGYPKGGADESCGFTRWSIAVREGNEAKVVHSVEALPREE